MIDNKLKGGKSMKKNGLIVLSMLMLLFFHFDIAKAQQLTPPKNDNAQLMEIKEKRKLITKHLQKNKELENLVEIKSKKVEDLLVKVPENKVIPQAILQNQIGQYMDIIMNHLSRISEQEKIMWESINAANKDINKKNYTSGIKKLDRTIDALEKKYEYLTVFNKDLDDLLSFFSTIQQK